MEALAQSPPLLKGGGTLEVRLRDPRHALLRLSFGEQHIELRAAFLSVPYPSGLRRLLARESDVDAVIVDRIPPGLTEAAEELGIAILDRAGYGRVVAPAFVYVAIPPRSPSSMRSSASPFAPKASRIVRALLADPGSHWRLLALAERVDVDAGNAHRIFASLTDMGLVERDEDAYVVTDPGSLLEAWAEFNRRPREQVRVTLAGDLEEAIDRLVDAHPDGLVVSGEFAAERLAPYLPAQSAIVHCLDRKVWEQIAQEADRSPAFPGYSLHSQLILDLPDEGVAHFGGIAGGIPVVHPVQLYVDLFGDLGRGREAAEHLRRQWIAY